MNIEKIWKEIREMEKEIGCEPISVDDLLNTELKEILEHEGISEEDIILGYREYLWCELNPCQDHNYGEPLF